MQPRLPCARHYNLPTLITHPFDAVPSPLPRLPIVVTVVVGGGVVPVVCCCEPYLPTAGLLPRRCFPTSPTFPACLPSGDPFFCT